MKRLRLFVMSLALISCLFTASSVFARTSNNVYFFKTADDCLRGYSTIGYHGTIKGIVSEVDSESSTAFPYPPVYCSWLYDRPVGWMAAAIQNWRWTGSSWALCAQSDWLYNKSVTAFNSYDWNLGIACGGGWYGTHGGHYVWRDDKWQGGWVWSGAEKFTFITANGEATPSESPPPPDWVRADGTIDLAKLPDRVDVVGRDGLPTGLTVDLRELKDGPVQSPGGIAQDDPPGVVRTYRTLTSREGNSYGSEEVTLTADYQGLVGQ